MTFSLGVLAITEIILIALGGVAWLTHVFSSPSSKAILWVEAVMVIVAGVGLVVMGLREGG